MKETKMIEQPNSLYDSGLDLFAVKDTVGKTGRTWTGSEDCGCIVVVMEESVLVCKNYTWKSLGLQGIMLAIYLQIVRENTVLKFFWELEIVLK